MWIQCTNEATTGLYNDEVMDEPVGFSDNGTAQVPADVGEQMIDHYDVIEPYDGDETE